MQPGLLRLEDDGKQGQREEKILREFEAAAAAFEQVFDVDAELLQLELEGGNGNGGMFVAHGVLR